MGAQRPLYSLPFRPAAHIRRATAPSHRVTAGSRFAIDFAMPEGTPVLAARDGVVVFRESRWSRAFTDMSDRAAMRKGNAVVLRHDDGSETVYAHVAWRSVRFRVGEVVRRGDVIALSGQTGYAAYPHLHFAVYDAAGRNVRPAFREPLPRSVSWRRLAPGAGFDAAAARRADRALGGG